MDFFVFYNITIVCYQCHKNRENMASYWQEFFTDTWATKGGATLRAPVSHRLMRILDSDDNKEYFKLYRESSNYQANHHEAFKNTKDSAGYVFNG